MGGQGRHCHSIIASPTLDRCSPSVSLMVKQLPSISRRRINVLYDVEDSFVPVIGSGTLRCQNIINETFAEPRLSAKLLIYKAFG
jgi:hypothetical protein